MHSYFLPEWNALIEMFVGRADNSMFTCLECGKMSTHKINIVSHVESHHVESPGFACDVCGNISKTRASLRMHRRRHKKMLSENR